jgi:hypothetical protein
MIFSENRLSLFGIMLQEQSMHVKFAALPIVAALSLAAPAPAQETKQSPLPSHLPLGIEACFGRVYDANHLRQHPRQRVTSFHLFRSFSPDPNAENVVRTREELLDADGEGGFVLTDAFVRFRDRPGLFYNSLACVRSEGTVRCGIDCDGGGFKLRTSGHSLLLDNEGFVVIGGCGASDDENEQRDFVKPGADDRVFRLDPKPVAECAAVRDQLKPAWAKLGAPLRERLDRSEAVCFSRSYDAAHLGRHPQQTVRRIAVLKPDGGKPLHEMKIFELTFRIELSNGRKFEQRTTCQPDKYHYGCTLDPKLDEQQDFYLTRAGDQHVMLRDRKGKLGELFRTALGTDDRVFRLEASPAAACNF